MMSQEGRKRWDCSDSGFLVRYSLQVLMWTIDFTGISAPYEAPVSPEIHIKTDETDVAGAVKIIVEYLESQGLLAA